MNHHHKIIKLYNITKYENNTEIQNTAFQIYSGILSVICIIPNLISIIIIIFQKRKKNHQQFIELMLCISFIGIEIRFFPIIDSSNTYYFFQASISFAFIIIATYYQFIYSFIAYKLFISPEDLSKKIIKFFIYIFPFILFLFLILFIYLFSNLTLYFNFLAYPENPESGITHQLSKRVSHVFRITFFLLNFIYVRILKKRIYQVLKEANNININFTNKKFNVYRKRCFWYTMGMIIVMHPYLFRVPVELYNNYEYGDSLHNYIFSLYFHGFESLSGLIYWFIYIFNKNLVRKFLILFCGKNENDYKNEFIEEQKLNEDSIKDLINDSTTCNNSFYEEFISFDNKTITNDNLNETKTETIYNDENL